MAYAIKECFPPPVLGKAWDQSGERLVEDLFEKVVSNRKWRAPNSAD